MQTPQQMGAEPPVLSSSPEPTPAPKKERGVLSLIAMLIVAFLLVQVVNMFLFQSYRVFGNSMVPTLHDGDRLIISKVAKTTSALLRSDYQPQRGDIVVFSNPREANIQLIKRVIGVPGDRVVVENGHITVYNQEHPEGFNPDEAYGQDLPATSGKTDITVPKDHVFVSGDNRLGSNSLDSRNELGTVPDENIIGSLSLRFWPLRDARFF